MSEHATIVGLKPNMAREDSLECGKKSSKIVQCSHSHGPMWPQQESSSCEAAIAGAW